MNSIDCCIRHSWASETEFFDYLPAGWREYMAIHAPREWHDHLLGFGERPTSVLDTLAISNDFVNPLGDEATGSEGCASPEALARGHLDRHGIDRAVLCHDDGILVAGIPTVSVAIQLTRAINDWTVDRWLSADDRLRTVILVATQAPDAAAAEIRRLAGTNGVVGVLMGATGLAKPFGHPVYDPIHRAAHETGLPIFLVSGGEAVVDAVAYPTGGGTPGTYAELRTLAHQALQSHVASLITLGVMDAYTDLRFMVLGGGIAWLTPWLWRLDTNHKAFRYDSLWLGGRAPSEIFKRHFRIGTHPLNYHVSAAQLQRYLELDPQLGEIVCYASGYPDWDGCSPEQVAAVLPADWERSVLRDNAEAFLACRDPVPELSPERR